MNSETMTPIFDQLTEELSSSPDGSEFVGSEPATPQSGGAHHAVELDDTQEWMLPPDDEVQAPPEVHGRDQIPGGAT